MFVPIADRVLASEVQDNVHNLPGAAVRCPNGPKRIQETIVSVPVSWVAGIEFMQGLLFLDDKQADRVGAIIVDFNICNEPNPVGWGKASDMLGQRLFCP
jgi:hypothetical protein